MTTALFNSALNLTRVTPSSAPGETFVAQSYLRNLLDSEMIHPEDWNAVSKETIAHLNQAESRDILLQRLADSTLINEYQRGRIAVGSTFGLVLGNYRVLDRIGAGGLGVVFLAEHVHLRRRVAVKVVPLYTQTERHLIRRFLREIQTVASLNHPNIVTAIDAGACPGANENDRDLYYFVMEYLLGQELEELARDKPLPVGKVCAWIYQIASALATAHQHQLIHRDIKPSNIFITQEGVAKLLDFGLVRQSSGAGITEASDIIGTLDYMAPEQARDPTSIDIRADIFALGATLFFALAGRSPFNLEGSVHEILQRRQTQHALNSTSLRPEIPAALQGVLERMLALDPATRLATPQAVMHALLPFVESSTSALLPRKPNSHHDSLLPKVGGAARPCVLIADHDGRSRGELSRVLLANGFDCLESVNGATALELLRGGGISCIIVGVDGGLDEERDLLKQLGDDPQLQNLKVIVTSANKSEDELAVYFSLGASDCLCLPLGAVQISARLQAAVRQKAAQDQMDRLNQQMLELNAELDRTMSFHVADHTQARNSLVLALAKLVEYRSVQTHSHLLRMPRYCTVLAQEASALPRFAGQISQEFLQNLECVAPLHDIGNVGLPDAILLKAGPLTADEHHIMTTHTIIGADTLRSVAQRYGASGGFLAMAIQVARSHHEHIDGSGYPDGLASDDIPLAARIVALADAYDSLRSRRAQRPRLSHASAAQIILETSPGKFDPGLLTAFERCAAHLDRIFREVQDSILSE